MGAQRGLLLRGGDVLERCAAVDTVVFDKTGTLTEGCLRVQAVLPAGASGEVLRACLSPVYWRGPAAEFPWSKCIWVSAQLFSVCRSCQLHLSWLTVVSAC